MLNRQVKDPCFEFYDMYWGKRKVWLLWGMWIRYRRITVLQAAYVQGKKSMTQKFKPLTSEDNQIDRYKALSSYYVQLYRKSCLYYCHHIEWIDPWECFWFESMRLCCKPYSRPPSHQLPRELLYVREWLLSCVSIQSILDNGQSIWRRSSCPDLNSCRIATNAVVTPFVLAFILGFDGRQVEMWIFVSPVQALLDTT